MPRESRRKQEVDVSQYQPLVDEALRAFGSDVSYAVAMSRAAVTIERKRKVWRTRTPVREAEKRAKEECERRDFKCDVENPCGTGSCMFAPEELKGVNIIAEGDTPRPHNSTQRSYSIEPVVAYLNDKKSS